MRCKVVSKILSELESVAKIENYGVMKTCFVLPKNGCFIENFTKFFEIAYCSPSGVQSKLNSYEQRFR